MNTIYPNIDFFISESENVADPIVRLGIEWWSNLKKAIQLTNCITNTKALSDNFCKTYANTNNQQWVINKNIIHNIIHNIITDKTIKLGAATSQAITKNGFCDYPTTKNQTLKGFNFVKDKLFNDRCIYSTSCWKYWAYTGELHKFIKYASTKNLFIVGPHFFKNFGYKLNIKNFTHIEIPLFDAANHTKEITKTIINTVKGDNNLILMQGGSAIPELMLNIKKMNGYMLDVGRALDVYYYFDSIRKGKNNTWGIWLDKHNPNWIKKENIKII